mgnify:CR=1 FL=1
MNEPANAARRGDAALPVTQLGDTATGASSPSPTSAFSSAQQRPTHTVGPADCERFPECDCPERVRRCLDGDQAAQRELVEWFLPLVRTIVNRSLRNATFEEREEWGQEIWLRVFSKLQTWSGKGYFCKWLAGVAAHRCIDWLRPQQSKRHVRGARSLDTIDVPEPSFEIIACIEETAAGLPPELRTLYELSLDEKLTKAEIASQLGTSERMLYLRQREMRTRFRHCLEK